MATNEGFRALMARARQDIPEATWLEPEDLVRYGLESMVADEAGDARVLQSTGALRLHGAGVDGHSIDLDEVGAITVNWQRSVTAMGAALEDVHSSRGKLPTDILSRTRLRLTSSPEPGSVVLRLSPRSDPLAEVEPQGGRPLVQIERPLVDRASELLLDVFNEVAGVDLLGTDGLSLRLRDLGPRVASSLQSLANILANADIALDASWREPSVPTRRASWSADDARWLRDFIDGHELADEIVTLVGVAATVSDRERWLIETEDGIEKVHATSLDLAGVRRVRSGDTVAIRVRSATETYPDGTTKTRHDALELLNVTPPDRIDLPDR